MEQALLTTSEAISRFLTHRTGKNLADASLKLYRRKLRFWSSWRDLRGYSPTLVEVDLDELDCFFTYLAKEHIPHADNPRRSPSSRRGLAPESVASYRRVLRALWMFARARGWLRSDQTYFFGRDGVQIARVPELPRPVYEANQLSAMLEACGDGEDETSARDRTLVALLWESGGRISELLGIKDQSIQLRQRRAWIVGKGDLRRWLRWGPITQHELARYLQRRRGSFGGDLPLFRATSPRAGSASPIRSDSLRAHLRHQMELFGIVLVEGSPLHAFRRSFIQRGIDDGVDLSDVSQLAGHQDVRTTMRYARRSEERLDQIYEEGYVRRSRRREGRLR